MTKKVSETDQRFFNQKTITKSSVDRLTGMICGCILHGEKGYNPDINIRNRPPYFLSDESTSRKWKLRVKAYGAGLIGCYVKSRMHSGSSAFKDLFYRKYKKTTVKRYQEKGFELLVSKKAYLAERLNECFKCRGTNFDRLNFIETPMDALVVMDWMEERGYAEDEILFAELFTIKF